MKRLTLLCSSLVLLVLAVIGPPAYAYERLAVIGPPAYAYERLAVIEVGSIERLVAVDRFAVDLVALDAAIQRSAAQLPQGDPALQDVARRPLAPCLDVCTVLRAMPAPQHAQGRPQLQLHHLNL